MFNIDVPKESYEIAIAWMRNLLFGSIFEVSRLKNSVLQALAGLPMRSSMVPESRPQRSAR